MRTNNKRPCKIKKRFLSFFLTFLLSISMLAGSLQLTVFANEKDKASVITGEYHFTSNTSHSKQLTDTFTWRDDCFMRSSFLGCEHLACLSAQAALASGAYANKEEDPYNTDPSNSAKNVEEFLEETGFEHVEHNNWYTHLDVENSIGIAMGARKITTGNTTYTLLAILPRSNGYRGEWAGNFNVGEGDIHQGFLISRDEAIRYTAQYIAENNIDGPLKIWIAGHSRAGAIGNQLAAFFAAGGIDYFGDAVSITPEDVYCYTFASPRTVKDGVSKKDFLSVRSNGSEEYTHDTPGDAYQYPEDGSLDVSAETFQGLRNYVFDYDFIPCLPLQQWGFTWFGQTTGYEGISDDDVEEELKSLDGFDYENYKENKPSKFEEMKLDVKTMSLVNDGAAGKDALSQFDSQKMANLYQLVQTNESEEGTRYLTACQAYAGSVGMLQPLFGEVDNIKGELLSPLLLCYLAYASDKLQEEGSAQSEDEAASLAIIGLLEFLTGEQYELDQFTFDDFVQALAIFASNEDTSESAKELCLLLGNALPEDSAALLKEFFGAFHPAYTADDNNPEWDSVTAGEVLYNFIRACEEGAAEGTVASLEETYQTGENVRSILYMIIGGLPNLYPDFRPLCEAIGDGSGLFVDFVPYVTNLLKTSTNPNSEDPDTTSITYETLGEAADASLKNALDIICTQMLNVIEEKDLYTPEYIETLNQNLDYAMNHTTEIRTAAMKLLLDHEGTFDTSLNVHNIATIVGNINRIIYGHYDDYYMAHAKIVVKKTGGFLSKHPEDPADPNPSEGPEKRPDTNPDGKTTPGKESGKTTTPDTNTGKTTGPETGKTYTYAEQKYLAASSKGVYLKKAKNAKSVTVPATATINGKTIPVIGIKAKAFGKKTKTVTIKTTHLTKKRVKNALKGTNITKLKIKVGKAKQNKKYRIKYKKIFTKKTTGRKVTVK